mmetsp:Transcript_13889/g.13520  ORF Transcript_13889/g.13520 Transcript_13889/m.13520 type:complete len:230 (+) Transcript_13889:262-951(+)
MDEFNQRIFYKEANFFAIEINAKALESWENLIIEFQKVREDYWKKNIMNLSPCKDKWNPIIYPVFKEQNVYVYLTETSNKEMELQVPFPMKTGIEVPAEVCLKTVPSTIEIIPVGLAWNLEMPEFFFLSKSQPCFSTFNNRLKKGAPTMKVYGTHTIEDLTISPNFIILLRESVFHNIFVIFGQTIAFCLLSYHETMKREFSFTRFLSRFPIYFSLGVLALIAHIGFKD